MVTIKEQLVKRTDRLYSGSNPADYMTVHETANKSKGAGAQAHANLQSGGNVRQASWHFQSDDSEIIRSFRNNQRCWHAGDGKGPGNMSSLAWEICVNSDSDFARAIDLAARGIAQETKAAKIPRSHIVQHNHWSGKNCPAQIRSGEYGTDWLKFMDLVAKYRGETGAKTTPSRMVSPVEGYLTQRYNRGVHEGMDIGTGGKKVKVRAAFAGRVVQVYKGAKHGDTKSTWARHRTSNAVIVQNVGPGSSGDKEYQAYGHVTGSVKEGDQVQAGDIIGELDNSGRWTGWHLHLEMWSPSKRTYNPQLAFDRWGIQVGSKPSVTGTPSPKPETSRPKPPVQGDPGTLKIQRDLNRYAAAGLYEDGVNGPVTKAWVAWVKELQRALPAWKGIGKLVVDGHYGPVVSRAVATLQRRNGLYVDGIAGPKTIAFMKKHGSKVSNRPKNRP